MKIKQFFRVLFLGATAFTLGSCSDDISQLENVDNPLSQQDFTLFSSGDPETTRTTTHYKSSSFPFYWTTGDHIWVYKNDPADAGSKGYNQFNHSHSGSTFSEHEPEVGSAGGWAKGHFSVSGVFNGNSYNVYYVGQASPSIPEGTSTDNYAINGPLQVTVKNEQMQLTAYNADHFATSGDCGYAEATKVTNGYKFKMNHMASYLMIYPWHDIKYTDNTPAHLILDKITIDEVSEGGPYAIAGTHEITNEQTVLQPPVADSKKYAITLECGPEEQGFVIPYNEIDYTKNGCFVVMSPSRATDKVKTRKLKMTFDYYDVFHRHFSFPYTMNEPKTFYGNTFRRFYPKISNDDGIDPTPDYDNLVFYGWDGLYPHDGNHNGMTNTHDNFWPEPAYQSCKYAPNVNELYWYWKNGDMRWDDGGATGTTYTYYWRVKDFMTDQMVTKSGTYSGGIWVKRREAILRDGNAATCQHSSHVDYKPAFCSEHAQNGKDWREELVLSQNLIDSGNYPVYSNKGKPENLDDYFFLPALGYLYSAGPGSATTKATNIGVEGYYWSSSQVNGYSGSDNAFYLKFQKQGDGVKAEVLNQQRSYGYIAGSGWFH